MVVSEEEAKSGRRSVEREEREKKIVGVFEAGRARGPRDFDRLMTRSLCASREDTLARLVFFFLLASIKYRIPNALECDSKRSREREKGLKAGKMHAKESSLSLLSTFDRKNKKNKKNLLRRRRSDGARVVATTSDDADAGVCELDNHRFGCSLCRGSKRSLRASCVCFAPLRPSLGEERRVLSKEEEATRGSKKKNERMKEWKSEQGFRSQAATKYKNPNLSHKHFQLCDGVAPQEDEAQGASPGLEPEPVPEPPPRRRRGGGGLPLPRRRLCPPLLLLLLPPLPPLLLPCETSASGRRRRSRAAREDADVHCGVLCSGGERTERWCEWERDVRSWSFRRALFFRSVIFFFFVGVDPLDLVFLLRANALFTLSSPVCSRLLPLSLVPRRVGSYLWPLIDRKLHKTNVGTFDPDRRRRERRVE